MKSFAMIPFFILMLLACNFNPNDKILPQWEMDILGPLVKADLNIQNIAQLDSLYAKQSLSLSDFGIPGSGVPVIIPAFGPMNLGPYALDLTDAFASAELESGELYFKITNQLEVNVKSGTTIVLNNGASSILTETLSSNIPALTGSYTSSTTNLSNTTISSNLSLEIQNFRSDGSGGAVITDPDRRLTIEVFLKNVKVKTITVTTTETFSITDTSDFSISGSNIKSQSVSGVFNTFITNEFPLDFNFQIYFMDESKTLKLDSLFDSPSAINASSGGIPYEAKLVTTLNETKINNLNKSHFARTVLKLNTSTNSTISNNTFIKVQLVGDLKLKLSE